MVPDASGGLPTGGVWWPLLLSTFAGLSTSIGGLIAINLSPDESTLAFLLGSAVGVMSTVSIAELWVHKAVEHSNWLGISIAVAAGGVVFAVLDPLLPKPVEPHTLLQQKTSQQVRRLQHTAVAMTLHVTNWSMESHRIC
jgi:zinc transporter ZupT